METISERDGSWVGLTLDEQLGALRRGHLGSEYYQGVARAMNEVPLAWFGKGSDDRENFVWLFDFLGFDLDDVDSLRRVRLGEALVRFDDLVRRCLADEGEWEERERLAHDVMRAMRRLLDVEQLFRVMGDARKRDYLRKCRERRLLERIEARKGEMLGEPGDADGWRRSELAELLWGDGFGEDRGAYKRRIDWARRGQWGPVRRFGTITVGQLFDGVGRAVGEDLGRELERALSFDGDGSLTSDESVREAILAAREDFRERRSQWIVRHDPSEDDLEADEPDLLDYLGDLDFLASDEEDDPADESPDDPSEDSPDPSLPDSIESCIHQSLFYRLFVLPLALLERCGR